MNKALITLQHALKSDDELRTVLDQRPERRVFYCNVRKTGMKRKPRESKRRASEQKVRERARFLLACIKPLDEWLASADACTLYKAARQFGDPVTFYHRFVKALSHLAGQRVEGETIQ